MALGLTQPPVAKLAPWPQVPLRLYRPWLALIGILACLGILQSPTFSMLDLEEAMGLPNSSMFRVVTQPRLVLLRSIGNALPPRHDPQQAVQNLNFTLHHEENFPFLFKHWILNRIVDDDILELLITLLKRYEQNYTVIPFRLEEYDKLDYRYDYWKRIPDVVHHYKFVEGISGENDWVQAGESIQQDKNLYATNQNEARNLMIEIGTYYDVDWILPWDGNCFLHRNSYQTIYKDLQRHMTLPQDKYGYTPMNRAENNADLLSSAYNPNTTEEPQVILHRTAKGRFHPKLRYGRRNKVEFLQRLGVPGPWDEWYSFVDWELRNLGPFFEPIPDLPANYTVKRVGWTTRLSSGVKQLEVQGAIRDRWKSRLESMTLLLGKLDARVAIELHGYRPGQLLFYDEASLARDRQLYRSGNSTITKLVDKLIFLADKATAKGPWSVMDKPDRLIAASGNKHDFLGTRYQASQTHELDPDRFLRMQINTTILGLAYFMTDNTSYAEIGARNIRTWFLDSDTKMRPHFKYARDPRGSSRTMTTHRDSVVDGHGIYFLLEAVRLIERSGHLTATDMVALKEWFSNYMSWMESSSPAIAAFCATDAHGVWFDIQAVAVASFLNDTAKMIQYIDKARSRMEHQITSDGRLLTELKAQNCEYRQLFALRGWSILARMAGNITGRSVWDYGISAEPSLLCRAMEYTVPLFGRKEMCSSSEPQAVIIQRWWPVLRDAQNHCPNLRNHTLEWPSWLNEKDRVHGMPPASAYKMPSIYDSKNDLIAPFWNLGQR